MLGMSMGTFAFLMIILAFLSYWGVNAIERKVNKGEMVDPTSKSDLFIITVVAFVVAFLALFMYPQKQTLLQEYKTDKFAEGVSAPKMTVDEQALRLVKKDPRIQMIDLRDLKDFTKLPLPHAIHANPQDFWEENIHKALTMVNKDVIFISYTESDELKAYHLAKELGYDTRSFYVLQGGFEAFNKEILGFVMPAKEPTTRSERDTWRFRAYASKILPVLIKEAKPKKVVIPKVKRALGGCG